MGALTRDVPPVGRPHRSDRVANHGRPSRSPGRAMVTDRLEGAAGPGPVNPSSGLGKGRAPGRNSHGRHGPPAGSKPVAGGIQPVGGGTPDPAGVVSQRGRLPADEVPLSSSTRKARRNAWARGWRAGLPSRRSASAGCAHPLRRARASARRGARVWTAAGSARQCSAPRRSRSSTAPYRPPRHTARPAQVLSLARSRPGGVPARAP